MNIYDTQRDIAQQGLLDVLDYWWSKRNLDLHTQIPAKVVKVDNKKNTVTVQPLISTYINSSQTISFPECEVPVGLVATSKGEARITLPSSLYVGSVGLLYFSERDPTNWLIGVGNEEVKPLTKENLSMGANLYPIKFEVGLFTEASAIEWDSENIVIGLGKSLILVKPDGNVVINGCTITPLGNVVTKAGTDLDQLKSDFDSHVHGGVQSGGSSTNTPTIP